MLVSGVVMTIFHRASARLGVVGDRVPEQPVQRCLRREWALTEALEDADGRERERGERALLECAASILRTLDTEGRLSHRQIAES